MSFVSILESIRQESKSLYVVSLPDDTEISFRLPSTKQASQYAQVLSVAKGNGSLETIIYNHIFEEFVTDKYIAIHNENLKAGVPETIAKVILYLSGADEHFKEYTQTLWNLYREQTNSISSIMKRTICSVFGGYKFSDLDELTYQELVEIYIEAEKVLVNQGIIERELAFADQEEEKPVSVENMISQDTKDYQQFDAPEAGPSMRMTEDPAYKARKEEHRVMQKLRKRQGG